MNLINSTYKTLEQLENQKNETIHFEQQRAIFSPPDREKGIRFSQKIRCLTTLYRSFWSGRFAPHVPNAPGYPGQR